MLFVGDDWAEDHHDVEVQDETGRRLGTARLEEGIVGIDRLHSLLATHTGPEADPDEVVIGIETERGPWVQALLAAGYRVHAVNPLQVARYRERQTISGAKSDAGDAHALADMVRTDGHQLRTIAGDSDTAAAIKVIARAHKTLIWERTRHMLRLRRALRDFFPAALDAFDDLTAPDTLELLTKAPDPTTAARLTTTQITAALRRAHRRNIETKAAAIRVALRTPHLANPTRSPPPTPPSSGPRQRSWAPCAPRSPPCRSRLKHCSPATPPPRSTSANPASDPSSPPAS